MAGISSIMPRQHGMPVRCPWRSPVLLGGQERSVPYRIRTEPSDESLMLTRQSLRSAASWTVWPGMTLRRCRCTSTLTR